MNERERTRRERESNGVGQIQPMVCDTETKTGRKEEVHESWVIFTSFGLLGSLNLGFEAGKGELQIASVIYGPQEPPMSWQA